MRAARERKFYYRSLLRRRSTSLSGAQYPSQASTIAFCAFPEPTVGTILDGTRVQAALYKGRSVKPAGTVSSCEWIYG
jgi:hypothetical protein